MLTVAVDVGAVNVVVLVSVDVATVDVEVGITVAVVVVMGVAAVFLKSRWKKEFPC